MGQRNGCDFRIHRRIRLGPAAPVFCHRLPLLDAGLGHGKNTLQRDMRRRYLQTSLGGRIYADGVGKIRQPVAQYMLPDVRRGTGLY